MVEHTMPSLGRISIRNKYTTKYTSQGRRLQPRTALEKYEAVISTILTGGGEQRFFFVSYPVEWLFS